MLMNYWACKFSKPERENVSDIDNLDYEWKYNCNHPDNEYKYCYCDNKWNDEEDDCEFLGDRVLPDES